MLVLPNTVSVTGAMLNADHVLNQLRIDKRPVRMIEHGGVSTILLDAGTYDEPTKRAYILDRMLQV